MLLRDLRVKKNGSLMVFMPLRDLRENAKGLMGFMLLRDLRVKKNGSLMVFMPLRVLRENAKV